MFYCRFTFTEQVECDPNKEIDSDVRQGTLHFELSSLTLAGCRGWTRDMLLFRWQGLRFCNENVYSHEFWLQVCKCTVNLKI